MATIVNNPGPSSDGGGALFALLAILLIGFLFFYFGMPLLRRAATPASPQINVPDRVDVNVNQPKQNP